MTQFWDQRFWEKGVKSQFAYIFLFPQFSIFTSCSARASAHHRLVDCNLNHKKSPWRYRFSSSLPAFLVCPQFLSYCWMYFYMNFSSLLILDGKWWQFLSGSDYLLRIVTNSTKVLAVLKFWLGFIIEFDNCQLNDLPELSKVFKVWILSRQQSNTRVLKQDSVEQGLFCL